MKPDTWLKLIALATVVSGLIVLYMDLFVWRPN